MAYCQAHPGSKLIVVTWPLTGANRLAAHAYVYRNGSVCDNRHEPRGVYGSDYLRFAESLGYSAHGLHLFRVIDYDHQTTEDKRVIQVLKTTMRA